MADKDIYVLGKGIPLNEKDLRMIFSLANNDMRVTETAYELGMHRNSILYRINKIKKNTGLDPMKFYDLCELVEIAMREVMAGG